MIPNAGLDNAAAYAPFDSSHINGSTTPEASGATWMSYAAISEDSSEPQATDTNIGTEAMRTNATGGFPAIATAIRDAGTNRVGISIEKVYVFTIEENLNITKYGYVPLSTGGNFTWIDLTREDPNDPDSDPVTLTLVPGDELQLWRNQIITVPWSVDLEQFTITGLDGKDSAGTHDAYCGFYAANDDIGSPAVNNGGLYRLIRNIFWPFPGEATSMVYTSQATPNPARDAALGTNTAFGTSNAQVLQPYVPDTYYRDKLFTLTTAMGNDAPLTAFAITTLTGTLNAPNAPHGFKVVLDDPATIEKDNLHALTLTFRVSWSEG